MSKIQLGKRHFDFQSFAGATGLAQRNLKNQNDVSQPSEDGIWELVDDAISENEQIIEFLHELFEYADSRSFGAANPSGGFFLDFVGGTSSRFHLEPITNVDASASTLRRYQAGARGHHYAHRLWLQSQRV